MRPRSRYHDCTGVDAARDPLDGTRRERDRREPGGTPEALLRARVARVDAPPVDLDRDPGERRDRVDQEQRVGALRARAAGRCRSRPRSTSRRARPRAAGHRVRRPGRRAAAAGRSRVPHSASTRTTSAPPRRATSHIRSPNTPLTPTIAVSPGSSRLTKHASMPAEPVPEIGRVSAFSVRKTLRSRRTSRRECAGTRDPCARAAADRTRPPLRGTGSRARDPSGDGRELHRRIVPTRGTPARSWTGTRASYATGMRQRNSNSRWATGSSASATSARASSAASRATRVTSVSGTSSSDAATARRTATTASWAALAAARDRPAIGSRRRCA